MGIKSQIAIDPLINQYIQIENELFNCTFFDNFKVYDTPAEMLVEELVDNVDGYIICRNTIDHSEDPFSILNVISKYAKKGCYFLFWCDIWHINGGDTGHHCITHSNEVMDNFLNALGFEKIITMNSIRDSKQFIDYGGVFIKK
jgi:hypothetical protein